MTESGDRFAQCEACGHVQMQHQPACAVDGCSCPGFQVMTGEAFLCPSRVAQGQTRLGTGVDYWTKSSWGPHYYAKWPAGFERPRTCSYCGGIHPEDVIGLIGQGWEVDATDKTYKRYLEPPGYRASMRRWSERTRGGESPDSIRASEVEVVTPTPPVKLYIWHFDGDQRVALNRLIADATEPT